METRFKMLPLTGDAALVQTLYRQLLMHWEMRDAAAYAGLCMENCRLIGFDGSQMTGRQPVQESLAGIFTNHKVLSYVSIVEEVSPLSPTVYLLRAVVGMKALEKPILAKDRFAIQTMVAVQQPEGFRIAVFQNTPAAFDGRPEARAGLTERLEEVLAGKAE